MVHGRSSSAPPESSPSAPYYRIDREGKDDGAIHRLVFFNSLRLAAGTASSVVVLYLLASVPSA
jgi:hypothetical protein